MGTGEDRDPDRVRVLLDRGLDDLLRRLMEARIDDLHARVAQRTCDDLRAAVVAVKTRLCYDDTYLSRHAPSIGASKPGKIPPRENVQ